MAERTLDEIAAGSGSPATKGAPSMVAGTEEEAFVRFVSSHGPYKTEVLLFQQKNTNDFKADDTFTSQLAHPLWVTVQNTSDIDDTAAAKTLSAEITSDESNANFKKIYLRDAEDTNGLGVMITVYGF